MIPRTINLYRIGLEDGWEYEGLIPKRIQITKEMRKVSIVVEKTKHGSTVRKYPFVLTRNGITFLSENDYIATTHLGKYVLAEGDRF